MAETAQEALVAVRVRQLMTEDVLTLGVDTNLDVADLAMKGNRIRHVPIVDGTELVGLITHRDLLRASASSYLKLSEEVQAKARRGIPVREVMQTELFTTTPDTPAIEAAALLRKEQIGCLPVLENGKLVGIITEADFIEVAIRALKMLEDSLKS